MVMERPHWDLTDRVVGAMIYVHRQLGPGLLESTYETCLAEELDYQGIRFAAQVPIELTFRNATIPCAYRADLIVEDVLLVELKATESLTSLHVCQTLTYLKLLRLEVGLLVNFNSITLTAGLRRLTRR